MLYIEIIHENPKVCHVWIFKKKQDSAGLAAMRDSEIESARAEIQDFDSAMDISKFAQMYSSGILSGINNTPGFTPGAAISRGEAFLLIKRVVEHMP